MNRLTRSYGRAAFLALPLFYSCLLGCAKKPYEAVSITGTVKYEDGSLIPADSIMLMFESQEEAIDRTTHPRAGRVAVNVADGSFKVKMKRLRSRFPGNTPIHRRLR